MANEIWAMDIWHLVPGHSLISAVDAGGSAANDGPKRAEVSGEAMTFREGPWDAKIGHLVHMPGHIFIR